MQPLNSIFVFHVLSLPTAERFELTSRHNHVGVEIHVSMLAGTGVPALENAHTLNQHRLLIATTGSNPSAIPLAAGLGFVQLVCDALGHVRLSWLTSFETHLTEGLPDATPYPHRPLLVRPVVAVYSRFRSPSSCLGCQQRPRQISLKQRGGWYQMGLALSSRISSGK